MDEDVVKVVIVDEDIFSFNVVLVFEYYLDFLEVFGVNFEFVGDVNVNGFDVL